MDLKQLWITIQVKLAQFVVYNFFWITFTILLLVGGSFGYFVLFPKYQVYSIQKNTELPQLEQQLADTQSRLEQISRDQVDFTRIRNNPELQKLLHMLPTNQEVSDLFVEFDTMVREEKFKIVNLSISEDLSTDGAGYESDLPENVHRLQIQVSLAGTGYDSLKRLIRMLETNLRLMDVNSLSFVPNFNGTTLYSFMITTYYLED